MFVLVQLCLCLIKLFLPAPQLLTGCFDSSLVKKLTGWTGLFSFSNLSVCKKGLLRAPLAVLVQREAVFRTRPRRPRQYQELCLRSAPHHKAKSQSHCFIKDLKGSPAVCFSPQRTFDCKVCSFLNCGPHGELSLWRRVPVPAPGQQLEKVSSASSCFLPSRPFCLR